MTWTVIRDPHRPTMQFTVEHTDGRVYRKGYWKRPQARRWKTREDAQAVADKLNADALAAEKART